MDMRLFSCYQDFHFELDLLLLRSRKPYLKASADDFHLYCWVLGDFSFQIGKFLDKHQSLCLSLLTIDLSFYWTCFVVSSDFIFSYLQHLLDDYPSLELALKTTFLPHFQWLDRQIFQDYVLEHSSYFQHQSHCQNILSYPHSLT